MERHRAHGQRHHKHRDGDPTRGRLLHQPRHRRASGVLRRQRARRRRRAPISLLIIVALLSLNLGILNLLPIPALDGGRIPFLILEVVRRGRRLSPERENVVHLIGFVFLLSLVLFVTVGIDLPRLLGGESVLP